MDNALLDILACPLCKGKLEYDKARQQLTCRFDKLQFPVRDGIPVLLPEEGQPLNQEGKAP